MTTNINSPVPKDGPLGEYVILSLAHSPADGYALWWGPRNAGYTTDLNEAGRYTAEAVAADKKYYDNGDSTKAVLLTDALNITKEKRVASWITASKRFGKSA